MSSGGYGAGRYGSSGWGGPTLASPRLVSAIAIGENVVQLTFSAAMYWSGLLDAPDASSKRRYTLAPVGGTFGMDGTAAKPLGVASAALVQQPGAYLGQVINLTTDRPMTPSPAQYVVTCNGLFAFDGTTALDPMSSSATFGSVFKILQPPQVETLSPRGDIAMPQSGEATATGIVPNPSAVTLGSFVTADGDYAILSGLVEYKERCYRRIVTTKDAFLHLAGKHYGASLLVQGKKLGTTKTRAQLAGDIEQQIGLEPETAACACKTVPSASNPGEMLLILLAKTSFGKAAKLVVPINVST